LRFVSALRPLHWSKNLLVFVPVVLAHRIGDTAALQHTLIVFAAFCAVASGTYLINDCRDAEHDRAHPKKKSRLVASGAISVPAALVAGIVLVLAGLTASYLLSHRAATFVAGYIALSLAYSFALKRYPIVDVVILSAFYAIRVLAGGAAAGIEVSDWLMAFCTFLFICLALLKRYADLRHLAAQGATAGGRGYLAEDADLLRSIGVSCGMIAVLVFALYLDSTRVKQLYASPRLMWLIAPLLLYWISHMWLLAHRGTVEDDPIIVAAKDIPSYIVAVLVAAIALAAA
jgi:4-hydroxybenzoate polyprenyltransferase